MNIISAGFLKETLKFLRNSIVTGSDLPEPWQVKNTPGYCPYKNARS
jgi:hypothetical protein